jgi:hypothetical protein
MASYTNEHKIIAFSVFQKHGELAATKKELRKDPRFPTINKSTLTKWANEKDANGKTWKERFQEISKISNEAIDFNLAREKKQTIENLVQLKEYIFTKTLNTEVKTAEGGAKAYAVLTQALIEVTGTDIKDEILKQMSEAIFSALATHPVVGPVIKEYWEEIKPKIELNFNRMKK